MYKMTKKRFDELGLGYDFESCRMRYTRMEHLNTIQASITQHPKTKDL